MDGSHHPWLGDQAPPFTLLIAVDDATSTVVDALFCQQEDAHSYFLLIQACRLGHGALRAGRCSRSRSGRVSDSMAAELTAAWRRCSRFSRVGGPPG